MTSKVQPTSAVLPRRFGGHAAVDFVNTVGRRPSAAPHDFLTAYGTAVAWAEDVDLIAHSTALNLRASADREPSAADSELEALKSLREAMHRMFLDVAQGADPDEGDARVVAKAYAEGLVSLRLAAGGGRVYWELPDTTDLSAIRWLVAVHAMELLLGVPSPRSNPLGDATPTRPGRLKACDGHECGWLFLDTSKNASRRWCSMDFCGARAKMRAHYRRSRAAPRASDSVPRDRRGQL